MQRNTTACLHKDLQHASTLVWSCAVSRQKWSYLKFLFQGIDFVCMNSGCDSGDRAGCSLDVWWSDPWLGLVWFGCIWKFKKHIHKWSPISAKHPKESRSEQSLTNKDINTEKSVTYFHCGPLATPANLKTDIKSCIAAIVSSNFKIF